MVNIFARTKARTHQLTQGAIALPAGVITPQSAAKEIADWVIPIMLVLVGGVMLKLALGGKVAKLFAVGGCAVIAVIVLVSAQNGGFVETVQAIYKGMQA
jgi:hypothetical protein